MSIIADIANEKIEMDMTPMIDVTFLLLIFFMCTIKFKTLEGKLAAYLPKGEGPSAAPVEPSAPYNFVIGVTVPGHRVSAADPTSA